VQYATALMTAYLLDILGRDLAIVSETAGRGSYTIDPDRLALLPAEARAYLAPYRIVRI
jgi:hypothetical protein